MLQIVQLVVQVTEAPAAGDGLVEHGPARHFLHVLSEIADGQLPGNGDVPFVRRFLADDHAEERGLAGAVGPDETDLFTGIELEGSVDEDQLLAVLFIDVRKGDQNTKLPKGDERPLAL